MEVFREFLLVNGEEAKRQGKTNVVNYMECLREDIESERLRTTSDMLFRLAQDMSVSELAGDVEVLEYIKVILKCF